MFWYDNLYLGKHCILRVNRLKYKITHRIPHPTVYLIALPRSENSVLEMIPSQMLMQKLYPKDDLRIIGMGADRGEAMELMRQIIDEVYREQGNFDVAAFMDEGRRA